jgi:hypothetical protein
MQPKLFKETGNSDEFKKYLTVDVNTSFRSLSPHLWQAEQDYLKPLLGEKLFNELADMVEHEAVSGQWVPLLDYVRFSEMNLCYYLGFDLLGSSFNDSGFSTKAQEGTRLYRYQEENAKNTLKTNGFNIMDVILDFLHTHIDDFQSFKESEFYIQSTKTLIPDTKTFNSYYNIGNSRLVFLKMKHYIKMVEDIEMRHYFGEDFFKELLSADLSSEKYAFIGSNIRAYIVYMSVVKGIGELKKMPTEKGLIFESSVVFATEISVSPVVPDEVKQTVCFHEETAKSYLSSAINYLKKKKEEFPAFIAWAGENAPETTIVHRDNKGKKTFFTPINLK